MHHDIIKWAILGTSAVAWKFAIGLRASGGRVLAVGTRDVRKGDEFLASLPSTVKAAGSFATDAASAASTPGISAVYIATPPSLHESHAMLAIESKRAILIEKPLAMNADSAERIASAARAAGVFCMEALWTRFLPMTHWLSEQTRSGKMGEVRAFSAEFMGSAIPTGSLFSTALGGGALLHRGIYPISLALMFLGPVTCIKAAGRIGPTGVDEDATVVMTHNSGAISTVRASISAGGSNEMVLSGTNSSLIVDPPVFRPFRARWIHHGNRHTPAKKHFVGSIARMQESSMGQLVNRIRSTGLISQFMTAGVVWKPYYGNGYGYEAAEVARGVANGDLESSIMPLGDSIEALRITDEARAIINSNGSSP